MPFSSKLQNVPLISLRVNAFSDCTFPDLYDLSYCWCCPAAYLWSHLVLFVSLWAAEDGGGFLGGFEGTAGVKSTTDNLSFSAMHRSSSIILSRRSSSLPHRPLDCITSIACRRVTHIFPELPAGCSTEDGEEEVDGQPLVEVS